MRLKLAQKKSTWFRDEEKILVSVENVDVFENVHVLLPVGTTRTDSVQMNEKFVRKAGATLLQTQNFK